MAHCEKLRLVPLIALRYNGRGCEELPVTVARPQQGPVWCTRPGARYQGANEGSVPTCEARSAGGFTLCGIA